MKDAPSDPGSAGLRRFRHGSAAGAPACDREVARGRIARTLAASKPGGWILCVDGPELTSWLLQGLDITGKLVCLTSEKPAFAAHSGCQDDIRLTLHCQHPIAFLSDVGDHRFDLMVFSEMDAGLAEMAAAGLAPGGLLAVLASPGASPETHACHEAVLSRPELVTSTAGNGAVIAARCPGQVPGRRRGRRRTRSER